MYEHVNPMKTGSTSTGKKHYLSSDSWPNFQCVIVGSTNNFSSIKFQTSDYVIIMSFEYLIKKWHPTILNKQTANIQVCHTAYNHL